MSATKPIVPHISLLKILVNLPKFIGNPAISFKEVLDKHNGVVTMDLPYNSVLATDRPELMRHVLQQNNRNYIKTSIVRDLLKKQLGNGLLTSEGDYWLKQRRAIQPGFHRKRLEGIASIMVAEINKYLDDVFDSYAETEQEIDIAKEMTTLAFKIVSKSLFGQEAEDDKLDVIEEIVSQSQQFMVDQVRKPMLKPWYRISGAYTRNQQVKEKGDALVMEIIHQRQQSTEEHHDLLDMLIQTRYEDGSGMTDQQLLDEAIILYVAGHETSANAMAWLWYLLGTHPEIEEKVLRSVNESIGDKAPSFENLRDLGYCLQVVEETMRLYPPAWIIDREPLEDDEFEGIPIKKGKDVICFIYGVHRSERYWSNPTKFDPERFSAENKAKQIPFSYMPFGGGPRLCIGNSFALMEMQFVLAMMIKRYHFEVIKDQVIDINPMVTLRPKYGIKVIVRKRN
ncbi:MAG: cytochrome P450 [Flavobacteriales bacterium]|nr:cytochrome P450 [Flavobacteriales bacterium]